MNSPRLMLLCWSLASLPPGARAQDAAAAAPMFFASVQCGIDVLRRDGFAALRGQRVGLITNHTGRCRDGTTTLDALRAAKDVRLTALFSPEHGFAGKLDEKVGDSRDAASGLPIFSLYGDSRKPTAAQLAAVDTLVFDIQDIGCRFYTYISTMGLAMDAAAESKKRFVVLDRPNPIGGALVEGPVLDAGRESFVGWHAIAVRHGMTIGELAAMFAAERKINVRLDVIAVEGWQRQLLWDRCDLEWVNPSPNMRSLTEALLYPGVGLLETTNLSVGRGTDTPFELVGAPWLDGAAFARWLHGQELPGVTFVPVRFTPGASKFKGETCGGVQIAITDRATFRALPLGLAMACGLRALHAKEWQMAGYDKLLLDGAVLQALESGANWPELMALYEGELAEFSTRRARYLRYP